MFCLCSCFKEKNILSQLLQVYRSYSFLFNSIIDMILTKRRLSLSPEFFEALILHMNDWL